MHSKTLLTAVLSSALAGCASTPPTPPPEPTVITEYMYPDCGVIPARDPVNLRSVSWKVINGLFTLTPDEYENLSYNVSEITRGVKQLSVQLDYYEQCVSNEEFFSSRD